MNVILLSGGSGKRLWPLSKDVSAKQFLKIFRSGSGESESMLQRVYKQIMSASPGSAVTVAASEQQIPIIRGQLGDAVSISAEPCRRDTFPAIALATAYLHDVKKIGKDQPVVVCPVDSYAEDDYYAAVNRLWELTGSSDANLILMGIAPTHPSEKYGYIIPEAAETRSCRVRAFKEKPDTVTAEHYIKQGALWNAGVFAYKIKYVLDIAEKFFGKSDYRGLLDSYGTFERISFDYAVVEKEPLTEVIKYSGKWQDIGTWDTLTDIFEGDNVGSRILQGECSNVHIINESETPVLCVGISNAVVIVNKDGILISDKSKAAAIKQYVDMLTDDAQGRA